MSKQRRFRSSVARGRLRAHRKPFIEALAGGSLCIAALAVPGGDARAQDEAAAAPEEIMVTGSRLRRDGM